MCNTLENRSEYDTNNAFNVKQKTRERKNKKNRIIEIKSQTQNDLTKKLK